MHNEAFAKLGLDYCYMCYEVNHENLEKTVEGLKAMKVRGWNVSMPNKTTIVKYLDHLTPVAKMGQAVNTVINDDGVLTGTTTDGVGFIKVLKESNLDPIGKKITIVGAGGAVTAIEIQAALDGVAEISIFNRKDEFYNQGLINCKNINENTQSKAKVFDWADHEALRKDFYVADTVYAPKETELLRVARKFGVKKAINGEGMMLYQGAESFKLWTGKEMTVEHIKDILNLEF